MLIQANIQHLEPLTDFSIDPDFLFSTLEDMRLNSPRYTVFPGFLDVHVHFREPGFSYKETIYTGSRAAARGGYTAVCAMPNVNPVPDSLSALREQTRRIDRDAVVRVYPYGAITVGERGEALSDMAAIAGGVCAFSDDGHGVQSDDMMREAMVKAKALNKIIAAHCEDNSLLHGGYIHDGAYAREHGHPGISSESEYGQVRRDLCLAEETGVRYHVCHISCRESVRLIREAKARGVDVTCETAPHYLLLTDSDLRDEGRFRMNPPLRSEADRDALTEGLIDGTIDMIATDHAPHSEQEKSGGLKNSAFGVVGLETAFPLLYTYLVKNNIISLSRLIELMAVAPRKRFGLPMDGFSVWDLEETYPVDSLEFLSKGRATPFEGFSVSGKNLLTICRDKTAYINKAIE